MNTIRRNQLRIDRRQARRAAEHALVEQINRMALERHTQAQRAEREAKEKRS